MCGSASWGIPESAPDCFWNAFWGLPESARGVLLRLPDELAVGSAPESTAKSVFPHLFQAKALSGALPGTLPIFRTLFLGVLKKSSESTRGSTFGDSP